MMSGMTTRRYPTALTAPSQQDPHAIRLGIGWVQQQLQPDQQALVWTPDKPSLMEHPPLAAFARANASMTPRTRTARWSGGPVLAGWPTTDELAELADDRRVSALCVIPHGTLDEVAAWAAATAAVQLGAEAAQASPQAALDPVVVQGLETLTVMVNHANQLAGSSDRRDAVAVLTTLHRGGYALTPAAVYAWALAHGWPARGAQRLREMCNRLSGGHTLRAAGADRCLRPDILQHWQQGAAGGGG
ncbi:hypothetical protein GA0070615_2185 [Micromonospora aurantiaca]|nr:hypothetical protein GA0070615_2185 [Micromonospora aurantiaca]